MNKDVIISVDAGGTGTRFAVIDSDKNIIESLTGKPGNKTVNPSAIEDIKSNLKEIFNKIQSYNLKAIVMGMSGIAIVDTISLEKELREEYNCEVCLVNDAHLALYSILGKEYENGVVIISGTGAIIEALNNGKTFTANGWGQLLTERGSGYTVVKDFVCEMIHHNEQRGYYTELEQEFLEYCGCKVVEDFKPIFYCHHKDEVAKLCKFFLEKIKENNKEAIDWIYYNGTLLGLDAISSLKRVNMDKRFAIGFRGGFITNNEPMIKGIIDTLNKEEYDPIIIEGDQNPIYGGYYLARRKGYIK